MVEDLDSEVRIRKPPIGLEILRIAASGLVSGVYFYEATQTHEARDYLFGAGGAAFAVGGVAALVAPGEYGYAIVNSSAGVGGALFVLGWGEAGTISPYAVGGISGALLVESAFSVGGALAEHPVSAATLAADYELIRTPEHRSALTADQLSRIDADFRRTQSPLPRWMIAAPWFVGGSIAIGAAFADARYSDFSRVMTGLAGGLLLIPGALTLFPQWGYEHYEGLLQKNGLRTSVQGAPGHGVGLQLRGRF
jgi:hypothetical protein